MNESTNQIVKVEPTPMTLLDKAMDKGVTPEELTQWMDLEKRWREEKALQAYNIAFNACQEAMPRVIKDKDNSRTNSRYARLEAVNAVVVPCYVQHGFSMSFSEESCPIEGSRRIVGTVRHKDGHSEKFYVDMPMDGAGAKGASVMNGPQSLCSTMSYAQRRVTCMAWNLTVADSDDDGNYATATLTEEQVFYLQGLVDQCEDAGDPLHRQRFFSMFNLPADSELGDIIQSKYEAAKNGLQMKLSKAKKAVVS